MSYTRGTWLIIADILDLSRPFKKISLRLTWVFFGGRYIEYAMEVESVGYRIDYGTGGKRGRVLPMVLFGCFFTLLGVCLVPQGRQTVWDMLVGGDGEGARQIASMLQRSLSEGEAAAAAVWAVFREAIGKLG